MTAVNIQTEIPGPKSRQIMEQVSLHTPNSVGHTTPVAIARGQGALVTDVDGNTFIDFTGGIGTLNVGHCHPAVVEAVRDQAEKFLHTSFMVLTYEPYVELAARLNRLTPGNHAKKTMFFNSGSEAIENVVKIARSSTGRHGIIAFDRAFHGRTMMCLALTGQYSPYKVGFGPFDSGVHRIPYPYSYRCSAGKAECQCDLTCLQPLRDLFRSDIAPDQVAAIIVEPVLGEGGFVIPPPSFLPQLRKICDQHGILLIADEVQCGFARTGKMLAIEHSGVVPDLVVMAKSLAAGTPLAAVTGRADIMDALVTGSMGGTYGGNPMACRAALAAIDVIEKENLCQRSVDIGAKVMARFHKFQERFPLVGEVRGIGAMIGLELVNDRVTKEPATSATLTLVKACIAKGLLILKAGAGGNVIRTLMPLVITDEQLEEALDILEGCLAAVSEQFSQVATAGRA